MKNIIADYAYATASAVEEAIASSAKSGKTATIECLKRSTRLAIEADLAEGADLIQGDVYSGLTWDDEDGAPSNLVRWTVTTVGEPISRATLAEKLRDRESDMYAPDGDLTEEAVELCEEAEFRLDIDAYGKTFVPEYELEGHGPPPAPSAEEAQ